MAIPPLFMILPARMKKGMAIREKELAPEKIRWAEVIKEISGGSMHSMAAAEESPMAILMEAPMTSRTTRIATMMIDVNTASDIYASSFPRRRAFQSSFRLHRE